MLSTPFWNGTTTPPARDAAARSPPPALSVSQSLTANRTTSAGASVAGSSVTLGVGRWTSPSALSTREAALAHRGEMAAARDERDVVPRLREPRAEIAADAAGAHHRDAHRRCLAGCPLAGRLHEYAIRYSGLYGPVAAAHADVARLLVR